MKILSLNLLNYRRMLLNNITEFTIEPHKIIQLILGTNGSGKSSLLQELSPLPGNSNDFLDNGSKSIAIEHHGAVYDLKSTFSGTQKHNFFKNGVELNEGGTLSVQRELVKQEFGITPEIHSLMTNQVSLTSMNISDRRYWFTKLSDTNYDYAISVYNKLREKSRDVMGALKLAKKRLVTETAKVIGTEEKEYLQKQVDDLHNLLQHLIEYRKPLEHQPNFLKNLFLSIESEIINCSTSLLKRKNTWVNKEIFLNVEEAIIELQNLTSKCEVEKLLIDKYFQEHNEIQKSIDVLKETGGEGSNQLNSKILQLNHEIERKQKQKKLKLTVEQPQHVLAAFETVYNTLTTVFISLPENNDQFSKAKLNEVATLILNQKQRLNGFISELNKLETKKEHQEHQKNKDKTQCPQCNYSWSIGFDQNYYDSLLINIEKFQEQIDQITEELQISQTLHDDIINYNEIYFQFTNCVHNWPVLIPLWNHLLELNIVRSQPRKVLSILEAFKYDLGIDIENELLYKEIKHSQELLVMLAAIGEADINKLINRQQVLEELILTSTNVINNSNLQFKNITNAKKDIEAIIDASKQLEKLTQDFTNCFSQSKEELRRIALNEFIRSIQIMLSKKELLLSEIKSQVNIINDIQAQIKLLELEDVSYRLLVKELSPTDGLIAQGLIGFISTFVKQMNSFIKRIWLYPLQVIPCGIDEDGQLELSYKFPLKIQDDGYQVSDVVKGSSAMKEVVDLAFKVIAMKYLGLADSPLLLDEFAASFDNSHRVAAAYVIKELMDTTALTQLFMVSHQHAQYGSLTNAEICVLCSNNIVIPSNAEVNQHVVMS